MKVRKLFAIFMISLLILSSLSVFEVKGTNAPEWPFFHFNLKHSGKVSYSTAGNNGMLLWKTQLGGKVDIASPVIDANGTVYIGSADHNLYAVRKDGKIKWQYEAESPIYSTPAILPDGKICFTAEGGRLYLLNKDGTLKWKTRLIETTKSSPVFTADGTILVGAHNNYVYALGESGEVKWKNKPETGIIISSPAIGSDGTIYFGCKDYYLYAVTTHGTLKWKFKTGGVIDFSTPAIDGARNTIYIGSIDGYLYAVKSDGSLKWKFKTDGAVYSSPAISEVGTIFVGSKDSYLYAVNPDGTLKWKFKTDKAITSSPAIGRNGTVYIASTGGYLYAIGAKAAKGKIEIVMYPGNPIMTVNGVKKEIDPGRGTKPVIIPKWSRTVVPIRAIVEALGGTIEWDGVERKVTIHFNGTTINLWIDNPRAKVNGITKWIDENNHDVQPIIINDRTMLPLRFVAESLGCKVEWDANTRTITIIYMP